MTDSKSLYLNYMALLLTIKYNLDPERVITSLTYALQQKGDDESEGG